MSGEQAAVAEAAQIIATHTMCWQSDGDFGERQWIECNDIKCAWNDRDALDDVEAEYASFYAHVADTLVASGLLATDTPARLSDEEREAASRVGRYVAARDLFYGREAFDDDVLDTTHGATAGTAEGPDLLYSDLRILAARAVQPTPPAQAEAVAAVERVRALHTGSHRCWTGTAIAHYDRAPCPTLRAALALTATDQIAAMRNVADHAARQVADVEGRPE